MTDAQEIKKIVKSKIKEIRSQQIATNVYTLTCTTCHCVKERYDAKDFETWEKELWSKKHDHPLIHRLLKKIFHLS